MTTDIPVDVTDALRAAGHLCGEDRNDEDRVYEFGGLKIKVKTWHEVHPMPLKLPTGVMVRQTQDVFRVSGSVVGDDGKAIVLPDHPELAVYAFGDAMVVSSDAPVDLVREIELHRWACVRRTHLAFNHHLAARALTGVGVHSVN